MNKNSLFYLKLRAVPAFFCMLFFISSSFAQVIFSTGFEDAVVPNIPSGWAEEHSNHANWQSLDYGNQYEGIKCMYLANSYYLDQSDAWLFTPKIFLEAGKKYSISFYYKNQSYFNNVLEFTVGNDTIPAAQTQIIWHDSYNENYYRKAQINYTATETGLKNLAFHAATPSTFTYIYLDKFTVEEVTCFTPLNVQTGGVTTNTAKARWNVNNEATFYEYGVSESDTIPPTNIKRTDKNKATVSSLLPGKLYYFFVRSACSPGNRSGWSTAKLTTAFDASAFDTMVCGKKYPKNFTASKGLYLDVFCTEPYFSQEFFNKFIPSVSGVYTLRMYSVNIGQTMEYAYKDAALGAGPDGWTCISTTNDGSKANFGPLDSGKVYLILQKAKIASNFPSSFNFGIDCLSPQPVANSSNANDAVIANTKSKIIISPNPFHDKINITSDEAAPCRYQISISTIDGRVVKSFIKNVAAGHNQIIINTDDINSGMYFIKIEKPTGTEYLKLMKQ